MRLLRLVVWWFGGLVVWWFGWFVVCWFGFVCLGGVCVCVCGLVVGGLVV